MPIRRAAPFVVLLALALAGLGLVAGPAGAADPPASGLVQVSSFGSNPGNLAMYTYTPAGLPSGRPVVVALHGCTQTASDYYTHSGWPELADRWKFEVVFPQTSSTNNSLSCFNWYDTADDTRGNGEAASVRSMVSKAVADHGSNASRVYVTGLSAGGAMTANLLAAYPDVFAAGAVDAGIPAQCATSVTAATSCQHNNQNLTPAQWAAKVTAQDPGYTGPYPRVAVWQGTSDTTVDPVNATELRDQWTAVHGISQTPTSTDSLPGGTTRTQYADSAGTVQVQVYSISGMAHGLAVSPGSGSTNCGSTAPYFLNYICSSYYTGLFWGLDDSALAVAVVVDHGVPEHLTDRIPDRVIDRIADGQPERVAGPCFTASNYAQVQAGRAYQSGGYTYALGSNQAMGLYNTYYTHSLRQTGPSYWVIADGTC